MFGQGSSGRRLGALTLGITLMAGACGDDSTNTTAFPSTTSAATTTVAPTTTSTSTTVPVEGAHPVGGEVVIGELEPPVTLNFYAPGGESRAVVTLGQAYWAGVADVDGFTLELVPDVVVELPSVANGGLVVNGDGTETVTFVVDPRAVWADGTPISGEDFRFTYETIMDPALGLNRSGYEEIDPASLVVGEKTFGFTLVRPSLLVESLFGVLLPAHEVAGTDLIADWNDRMWVSGGPFQFDSWVPASTDVPFDTIVLTRNENYWKVDPETGQQQPYLDRVVFRFVGDVEALVSEFQGRELDVITPGMDPVILGDLQALDGAVVEVVGGGQWEHLSFQFGEGRLVRNPASYNEHLEFRRAVAYAVDRQALVEAVFGGRGTTLDSYITSFTPGWAGEGWAGYGFDQDAAREQLALLCAKDGVDCAANPPTMVFTTTSADIRMSLAAALEPMLEEVGIQVEVEIDPPLVFFGSTLDFGWYDVAGFSWKGSPGLASLVAVHGAWDPKQIPPTGLAYSRWGARQVQGQEDPDYNQGPSSVIDDNTRRYEILATEMRFTADAAELLTYFSEAEAILADQVVFLPLFDIPDVGVYWGDEIAGYRHNTTWAGDLWNVATWYRVDG